MTQSNGFPPPPNYAPPGFPGAAPAAPAWATSAAPPTPAPNYPPQYAPQGIPVQQAPAYAPPAAPAQAPPPWAGQPTQPAQAAPQGQQWRSPAPVNGAGFAGIGDAKVFTKTPFFPGTCEAIVAINELKAHVSTNPKSLGQSMLVVETVVVSSATLAPGSSYAQVINVGRYGASDVKQVIGALLGADPNRPEQLDRLAQLDAFDYAAKMVGIDPASVPNQPEQGVNNPRHGGAFSVPIILAACAPSQPFRGKQLKVQTWEKKTKPKFNGGPEGIFTMHNWRPVQSA